jgi:hypothetical protein
MVSARCELGAPLCADVVEHQQALPATALLDELFAALDVVSTDPVVVVIQGRLRWFVYPIRARSSGDRAFASGAKGRRFDSCRAHQPI